MIKADFDTNNKIDKAENTFITIGETPVRLVFADKPNSEVTSIVRDILKGAYIQRHSI